MINGAGKQALKNGGPAVTNSFYQVRLPLLSLRSDALYRHKNTALQAGTRVLWQGTRQRLVEPEAGLVQSEVELVGTELRLRRSCRKCTH